ncbi:hypothetical protein, partial [Methylobacterium nigriterrae]|uniref:hypothetical protein n=1 Tax=Methylobacterium nigriterrae TaxID=3127512 RepID=UPI003013F47C
MAATNDFIDRALTEKILRKAADHHRAGRQRDAERQYRRILESRGRRAPRGERRPIPASPSPP